MFHFLFCKSFFTWQPKRSLRSHQPDHIAFGFKLSKFALAGNKVHTACLGFWEPPWAASATSWPPAHPLLLFVPDPWPFFPLTSAEVLPLTTLSSPLCSKTTVTLPYYIAHRVTVITCSFICPFIYCLFPSLHPQNRASFGFLVYSSIPRPPYRDGSQSMFVEWPCEPPF